MTFGLLEINECCNLQVTRFAIWKHTDRPSDGDHEASMTSTMRELRKDYDKR